MLTVQIAILVALTLLNGAFAMSELAVVSSRRAKLQTMAEEGNGGARIALRLADDPSRFLSTVQIGITMVGVVAGAYGGSTLGDRLGSWLASMPGLETYGQTMGVALVLILITYTSIVLGELIPKRVALRNPEQVAALIASPMLLLSKAASPFVWTLGIATDSLLKILGLSGTREETVSEEEVRSMISEGTRAGVFDPREMEMIDGVLRLADRTVRAIMTPRPEVAWIDVADDAQAAITKVLKAGHSRFPVCRTEIDEVVGIVHARDLLEQGHFGKPLDLATMADKALVIHDRMPVLALLDQFRRSGQHLAVIVDEYGSVEGICTVTDILETIAGEFSEAPGEEPEEAAIQRDDGSWLVEGWMPIDAFEQKLGLRGVQELSGGSFHTVAGFVLNQLGHMPRSGEHFDYAGRRVEVVDMDGRRIDKILVAAAPQETQAP